MPGFNPRLSFPQFQMQRPAPEPRDAATDGRVFPPGVSSVSNPLATARSPGTGADVHETGEEDLIRQKAALAASSVNPYASGGYSGPPAPSAPRVPGMAPPVPANPYGFGFGSRYEAAASSGP